MQPFNPRGRSIGHQAPIAKYNGEDTWSAIGASLRNSLECLPLNRAQVLGAQRRIGHDGLLFACN